VEQTRNSERAYKKWFAVIQLGVEKKTVLKNPGKRLVGGRRPESAELVTVDKRVCCSASGHPSEAIFVLGSFAHQQKSYVYAHRRIASFS